MKPLTEGFQPDHDPDRFGEPIRVSRSPVGGSASLRRESWEERSERGAGDEESMRRGPAQARTQSIKGPAPAHTLHSRVRTVRRPLYSVLHCEPSVQQATRRAVCAWNARRRRLVARKWHTDEGCELFIASNMCHRSRQSLRTGVGPRLRTWLPESPPIRVTNTPTLFFLQSYHILKPLKYQQIFAMELEKKTEFNVFLQALSVINESEIRIIYAYLFR